MNNRRGLLIAGLIVMVIVVVVVLALLTSGTSRPNLPTLALTPTLVPSVTEQPPQSNMQGQDATATQVARGTLAAQQTQLYQNELNGLEAQNATMAALAQNAVKARATSAAGYTQTALARTTPTTVK